MKRLGSIFTFSEALQSLLRLWKPAIASDAVWAAFLQCYIGPMSRIKPSTSVSQIPSNTDCGRNNCRLLFPFLMFFHRFLLVEVFWMIMIIIRDRLHWNVWHQQMSFEISFMPPIGTLSFLFFCWAMGGMKLISNDIWWRHMFQCNRAQTVASTQHPLSGPLNIEMVVWKKKKSPWPAISTERKSASWLGNIKNNKQIIGQCPFFFQRNWFPFSKHRPDGILNTMSLPKTFLTWIG